MFIPPVCPAHGLPIAKNIGKYQDSGYPPHLPGQGFYFFGKHCFLRVLCTVYPPHLPGLHVYPPHLPGHVFWGFWRGLARERWIE